MLQRLFIQNYAIIELQEIEFSEGLSIITGETGAGKSILLGALSLVMGQRADSKVLYDNTQKGIVEATFTNYPRSLRTLLQAHDLDVQDDITMRREILSSGKSRAFINDTPVRLDVMQLFSGHLLDMHKQFESLEIQDSSMQYQVLDAFAEITKEVAQHRDRYQAYLGLKRRIAALTEQRSKALQERDYMEFQLEELQSADLSPGQLAQWETEYHLQDNAAIIKTMLSEGANALGAADTAVIEKIRQVLNSLDPHVQHNEDLKELSQRLRSLAIEAEDLSQLMFRHADGLDPNPGLLESLELKIDTIRRMLLKHGVNSDEELIEVRDALQQKLSEWDALNDDLEATEAARDADYTTLLSSAKAISKSRSSLAPSLAAEVTDLLHELEMKNATLSIDIDMLDEPDGSGIDQIEFLFSSNLGATQMPIRKVASGGELSRLSLCIKSIVSQKMQLPTLIFDEIDTGVSGQVALKMGELLKDLSQQHQVIMITHSPQIASRAQQHLMVSKHDRKHRSVAEVSVLDDHGRIHEIAKMLSGDPPSEAAVLNAKELMNV